MNKIEDWKGVKAEAKNAAEDLAAENANIYGNGLVQTPYLEEFARRAVAYGWRKSAEWVASDDQALEQARQEADAIECGELEI